MHFLFPVLVDDGRSGCACCCTVLCGTRVMGLVKEAELGVVVFQRRIMQCAVALLCYVS